MNNLEKNTRFLESNRLLEIKINDKVVIAEWKGKELNDEVTSIAAKLSDSKATP